MAKKKKSRARSKLAEVVTPTEASPPELAEVGADPPIVVQAEAEHRSSSVRVAVRASRARRAAPYAVLGAALLLTIAGWRELWFLTDDAFIAFRYVRNSFDGHGYVWNRAPFAPVDGYTSFGWVALLDLVWRITRVAPPESANVLSLLFALGTVTILWRWLCRLTEPISSLASRLVLIALGLAGTLSNRTFLAWTSSGLETAMYVFAVTAWLYASTALKTRRDLLIWGATAALVALTRPDGLPIWAMTVGLLLLAALLRRTQRWESIIPREMRAHALGGAALAFVPVLVFAVWRYRTYRTLLPNTYYAKVTGGDFDAGWRYVGSFVLEYAIWAWALWCLLALAVLVYQRKRPSIVALGSATALVFHVAYYALVVGGDHFEYKTFAHLVPLLWITACGAAVTLFVAAKTRAQRTLTWSGLGLVLAASLPIPWIHYAGTRTLTKRDDTFNLKYPVAPHLPSFARFYGIAFDEMQLYLIDRFYCVRHQEHKVFVEHQLLHIPDRGTDVAWDPDDIPVAVIIEAGVIGWRFPNVALIDGYGLNDRIVARNPHLAPWHKVGHERRPPPGYVEAFEPNIEIGAETFRWTVRANHIDGDRVRAIEAQYWAWLKTQPKTPYR